MITPKVRISTFFLLILLGGLLFITRTFAQNIKSPSKPPQEISPETSSFVFYDVKSKEYKATHYDFHGFNGLHHRVSNPLTQTGKVLSYFDNGFYYFDGYKATRAISSKDLTQLGR